MATIIHSIFGNNIDLDSANHWLHCHEAHDAVKGTTISYTNTYRSK